MKTRTLLAVATLAVATRSYAGPADAVLETLEQADGVYREALALEHGWAVTEPMMAEAHAALAAGDVGAAQAMADRALLTAEKSLEQAREERARWADRVVQR